MTLTPYITPSPRFCPSKVTVGYVKPRLCKTRNKTVDHFIIAKQMLISIEQVNYGIEAIVMTMIIENGVLLLYASTQRITRPGC
jgi:hypothetical protein